MFFSIVLVTFVSLSFVSVAALLQIQIANLKSYWFTESRVAIYLCSDFESDLICPTGAYSLTEQFQVARQLDSAELAPYIDTYVFESRDSTYQRLLATSPDSSLVSYLTPDQLNSVYLVSLADPEKAELVSEVLASQPGVASVANQQSYFDPIIQLLNQATLWASSIAAVMLTSAAILTSTTVRLSAFARRREIGIMRLVGASSASIQLPFVLESLIAALLGGLLAITLNVAVVKNFLGDFTVPAISFANVVNESDVFGVAPFVIGVGAILAVLTSGISTSRHLRS